MPAGETGFVGLYLEPKAGTPLPAPGTMLTFTVTATSTANPSIKQTQVVAVTMPAVDALTLTSTPGSVNTAPGVGVTDTLTITNAGNVAENNVSLTSTLSAGLSLAGLTPVTVAPGSIGNRDAHADARFRDAVKYHARCDDQRDLRAGGRL